MLSFFSFFFFFLFSHCILYFFFFFFFFFLFWMLSCSQNKTGLFSKPRSRGLGGGEALKPTALSIE